MDADLSGYFDNIPHAELMQCLRRRIVDGAMLHLLKMWLEAPVEETDEQGKKHRTARNKDEGKGTPQGAPISPLLSSLYMRRFVLGWKVLSRPGQRHLPEGQFTRPVPFRRWWDAKHKYKRKQGPQWHWSPWLEETFGLLQLKWDPSRLPNAKA